MIRILICFCVIALCSANVYAQQLRSIDASNPIGRGQRELIIGDRQTGRSNFALSSIFDPEDSSGGYTGIDAAKITVGSDLYTGGAFSTLLNPGTRFEVQVPFISVREIASPTRINSFEILGGFSYSRAHGNDDFQLNEPIGGGLQAEIDSVDLYQFHLDCLFRTKIRSESRDQLIELFVGAGAGLGKTKTDLNFTTFNPNKTQYFVPVGTGVSELEDDGVFGGRITAGAGTETRYGQFNLITNLFILQTGGVTGASGNSTGVTVGFEFRPGRSIADFNRDGYVDGSDYLIWRNNVGATEFSNSGGDANSDGTVDAQDFNLWQNQMGQ